MSEEKHARKLEKAPDRHNTARGTQKRTRRGISEKANI